MLPETKQLPLEEMRKLFTETPWFIGNSTKSEHPSHGNQYPGAAN
jgi:hypothetical protein